MKIAIFHDYFDEIGGAEITLLHLARGLNASIFTTNIDKKNIEELGLEDVKIESIGGVPKIKYVKQLCAQIRFAFLKLKNYDYFIFGGSFSIHASRAHIPNAWCCFSPLRGLYDLRYYKTSRYNLLIQLIKEIQIIFDKEAVKKLQKILAPSLNIQRRIKKYYKRDSVLIYHPVETKRFSYNPPDNYWLSLSRIDPYKRIELQLEAFKRLKNEKLIIVGGSPKEAESYFQKIKNSTPSNVVFKGPIYNKSRIRDLYASCKGFIATSKNEDFGLNIIEAMASGKPVIAPNEGGYKETVIDGATGKLIDNINVDKLVDAIREVGKNSRDYRDACLKQAKKFDVDIFIKRIKKEILKV